MSIPTFTSPGRGAANGLTQGLEAGVERGREVMLTPFTPTVCTCRCFFPVPREPRGHGHSNTPFPRAYGAVGYGMVALGAVGALPDP